VICSTVAIKVVVVVVEVVVVVVVNKIFSQNILFMP